MAQKDPHPCRARAELARREAFWLPAKHSWHKSRPSLPISGPTLNKAKKSLLDNGDKNFVNPKEKLYDHFPSPSIRWTSSSGCCLRSSPCF